MNRIRAVSCILILIVVTVAVVAIVKPVCNVGGGYGCEGGVRGRL